MSISMGAGKIHYERRPRPLAEVYRENRHDDEK